MIVFAEAAMTLPFRGACKYGGVQSYWLLV